MSREIKFRAWDGEEMYNDVYYVGDKVFDPNGGFWREYKEVMQFTGLKDMNGVEIYEGDILHPTGKVEVNGYRLTGNKLPTNNNQQVTFSEGAFKISTKPSSRRYSLTGLMVRSKGYEVIGNIYENKDILEVGIKLN